MSAWIWALLIALAVTQAAWIFRDARRRGEAAWLWGPLGLLNVPTSLIVYLLVTRLRQGPCPVCGRRTPRGARYCPHCGTALHAEGPPPAGHGPEAS